MQVGIVIVEERRKIHFTFFFSSSFLPCTSAHAKPSPCVSPQQPEEGKKESKRLFNSTRLCRGSQIGANFYYHPHFYSSFVFLHRSPSLSFFFFSFLKNSTTKTTHTSYQSIIVKMNFYPTAEHNTGLPNVSGEKKLNDF